jgi:predicted lysophospholipase L1 biosynthesis ABC-type transport system permease subunit
MLGLMLTDALTDNVRALLRGDIAVERFTGLRISFLEGATDTSPFSATNVPRLRQWVADNNAEITFISTSELTQAASVKEGRAGRPAFAQVYFIDPQVYPFYDTIRASNPSGVLLKDLLDGPHQAVVGQRLAEQLGVQPGDQLRIGTAKALHIVKGIVPDTAESSFSNPFNLLFSFMYLDRAYAADFEIDPESANSAYLKFPPGTDLAQMKDRIRDEWNVQRRVRIRTVDEVLESNQVASLLVSRFILLLSLVALVIGGVGIVNTMLVSVNRRAGEIAVLKTVGVKGRGVVQVFLSEAILIGLVGSLIGVVLGFILSLIARSFGEQAFGFGLPWRFQLDPALLGIGMGLVITIIFSVLPTLMAGNVRPGLVLRQGALVLARAGCLPSLLSLLALIVGLGSLIGLIIGDVFTLVQTEAPSRVRARGDWFFDLSQNLPPGVFPILTGILTVVILFLVFAIILGLAWVVVWLLGKLPSFRNANIRLALRGLTVYRTRTALSLLALVIGMTALSSTLILSRSINQLLYTTLSGPLGGNVVALPLLPLTDGLVQAQLRTQVANQEINGYRVLRIPGGGLQAINGDNNYEQKLEALDPSGVDYGLLMGRLNVLVGAVTFGEPTRGRLQAGRWLGPEDRGKMVMTLPADPLLDAIGVTLGAKLTYRIRGQDYTYEVVGLVAPQIDEGFIPISLGDRAAQVPLDTLPREAPFDFIVADVPDAKVNDTMAMVGAVPGVFVFDVGVFDQFLNRLFTQLAALPLLVAGLSLFAAAVLIATTVSLATLERRRQIGILKALGVKRRQTLSQLLIENGLVGFTGGVISLLPTLIIFAAIPALTRNLITLPVPYDLIALMLFLSIAITLGATLLTAWSASAEKPLTVLRYE